MKSPKTVKQSDSPPLREPFEFSRLFDASRLGFGIWEKHLRFRAVNKALAATNGVAPQAHLGKTIRKVMGEAAVTLEAPIRHVFFSGRAVGLEFWARLPKKSKARVLLL